ncbi:DoxX family protein [Gynuella sunshinyii]|uniref:Putative membrane protein n=1 Tax=Gynuella sunshinyii YC6258 TaxID=1445510 RepID=A0A0C5V5T1_9GAMM|nr:DoxX family protein [Gynuella sunshinyii]AJQ94790.1 putative membrane protein [Gynuella sunshinyii YC6258]
MNALIAKFNAMLDMPDVGKLVLRVSFGLMFLLHGIHKIHGGTDFIQGLLVQHGLPAFIAYGVYLGEVVAPLMLILGVYTRIGAFIMIGTCFFITYLAHMGDLFVLDQYGAWGAEGVGVYLFSAIAILFLGSGKYALLADR